MSIYWSHAALNIVTDFLIFLLPLTVIHKIRTPRPQKVALVIIFLLVFVICIISPVRVSLLSRDIEAGAMNITWDAGKTANWNFWQVNIAILCACLTTMKPIVSRFFPGLLSRNEGRACPVWRRLVRRTDREGKGGGLREGRG